MSEKKSNLKPNQCRLIFFNTKVVWYIYIPSPWSISLAAQPDNQLNPIVPSHLASLITAFELRGEAYGVLSPVRSQSGSHQFPRMSATNLVAEPCITAETEINPRSQAMIIHIETMESLCILLHESRTRKLDTDPIHAGTIWYGGCTWTEAEITDQQA
jgi:hypothetical protein